MIVILFSENIFQLQMIRKQSARIHQSLILCRRLTGVDFGEVSFQLAHGPVQEAADGLIGVFLVGRFDDEGHRVIHQALLHAARTDSRSPRGAKPRELGQEAQCPAATVTGRLRAPIAAVPLGAAPTAPVGRRGEAGPRRAAPGRCPPGPPARSRKPGQRYLL